VLFCGVKGQASSPIAELKKQKPPGRFQRIHPENL
jgi:hypothetical protein